MIHAMFRSPARLSGLWALALISCSALLQGCSGGEQPAAEAEAPEPRVFFVSPASGSEVRSPVMVEFGIEGFTVAPAGTPDPGTGHHHLLINTPLPPLDQPIPNDENHRHFGKGQTRTELELEPGEYTLQLLLGDGNHVPHDPALVSDPIVITVVE